MPPRFSYWTIIAGGLPTAFRAADREELLPTFTRLKQKQPDAQMKWFAQGKLWSSPEEARAARLRGRGDHRDERRGREPGPRRGDDRRDKPRETRGRDWRPGGEHRDPRQQFKDAKKARNQRFKAAKFARKPPREQASRERPHGDPLAPERRSRHESSPHGSAPATRKPWLKGSQQGVSSRPDARQPSPRPKPHGDPLARPPRGGNQNRPPRAPERAPGRWPSKPRSDSRAPFRGEGHGDNSWKRKPPRDEHASGPRPRQFGARGFERERKRAGGTEETTPPPRPRGPNREPRPSEEPQPSAPPRPSEPVVPPPGPPERGRLNRNKRAR